MFVKNRIRFPRVFGGFLERRIPGKNLEATLSYMGVWFFAQNSGSPLVFLKAQAERVPSTKDTPIFPFSAVAFLAIFRGVPCWRDVNGGCNREPCPLLNGHVLCLV